MSLSKEFDFFFFRKLDSSKNRKVSFYYRYLWFNDIQRIYLTSVYSYFKKEKKEKENLQQPLPVILGGSANLEAAAYLVKLISEAH
jgi:hypothetical protein